MSKCVLFKTLNFRAAFCSGHTKIWIKLKRTNLELPLYLTILKRNAYLPPLYVQNKVHLNNNGGGGIPLMSDGLVYFGKKNESECTIYDDPYTTMDQSVRRKMIEKNGSEYEEENERKIMDQST